MKLAFLLTQSLDSPSGLGRYLPLSKELARRGHRVEIFALHANIGSLERRSFEQESVQVHYVAPMHVRKVDNQKLYYPAHQMVGVAAAATWQLSRAALASDADIIYVGKPHPMNGLAGLAAKYLRRTRLCLDCDDYEAGSGNFGAGWQRGIVATWEKKLPSQARLITTNTHFMRQKLISWGAPAKRVVYLPNGVDRQRFQPPDPAKVAALRQQLGLEGKQVVLYIGSMSLASHAVDLLLQAFASVLVACPQAILLLVGGGEDYDRLQQQCRALCLEQTVRWVGRVPPEQAVYYYHLAQVSVDPVYDNDAARSRSPLKMFESWACGTPFVSADVGDRGLLSGSPPAAQLIQAGDSNALSTAICEVIDHPQVAEALRRNGFANVEGYYWDRLADQAERVLLEIGGK